MELIEQQCSAKKGECICTNKGEPVDGFIFRSPSCPVHCVRQFAPIPQIQPTAQELEEWMSPQAKKRVTYPKMTVARSGA